MPLLRISIRKIDEKSHQFALCNGRIKSVKFASKFVNEVEFYCEDAGRADRIFLFELISEVIQAGAKIINIPDTTGYTMPGEFGNLITEVKKITSTKFDIEVAVHCHNDLGMAVANSLAAVMGGTQSLHTNSMDEALALPSEHAVTVALRTQQIIGYESGVTDTPDPLAGSYFVESLTNEVERLAYEYIARIDEMGGAVQAIEAGFQMDEIEEAAYSYTKSIDDQSRVLVGVNKFTVDNEPEPKITPPIPGLEQGQVDRLTKYKANRDMALVAAKLDALREAAKGTGNVLHPMKEALRANATLGEVSDALRDVFGVYRPG